MEKKVVKYSLRSQSEDRKASIQQHTSVETKDFEETKITKEENSKHVLNKMATPKVDIKLGTSLIFQFDGNPDIIDSFIDSVNLFVAYTNENFEEAQQNKKDAANKMVHTFVMSRLTGKARMAACNTKNVDELIHAVKTKCSSKESANSLIGKLRSLKQTDDLYTFCEEVDRVTMRLKNAYLNDGIPETTAHKMATKCGVDALSQGINDRECRLILKAGSFPSVDDAIQKLNELNMNNCTVNKPDSSSAHIFYANRNGAYRKNYHSRGRSYNRGYYNNSIRGRGGYKTRTFPNRGYNNNPRSRGGFQQNVRTYHAQTDDYPQEEINEQEQSNFFLEVPRQSIP